MAFEEFEARARAGLSQGAPATAVSVFKYLPADLLTPVSAFLKLRQDSRFSFLLESVEGGEQLARYSFIGTHPSAVVKAFGPHTFVESCNELRPAVAEDGSLLDVLGRILTGVPQVPDASLPPLTAGAVGFLGYDTVRLFENLPDEQDDDLEVPDAVWGVFDSIVAFDHARQVIVLTSRVVVENGASIHERYADGMQRLSRLTQTLENPTLHLPDDIAIDHDGMSRSISRTDYMAAVERAREYIRLGDIFQVVLSQRLDLPFSGDPFNLYRSLRQTNPSPYLYYLDVDGIGIIGSSPESLVRVQDGTVSTVPIAGTRPRGETPDEDSRLADELSADPKELAEHVMLVDLGRNDIGRVASPGTVNVDDFQSVVRYSHVMHLVSLVTGQLAPEYTALDALRACFPAGTVSGAPKVRAMEIIDELEPRKRGPYAGAVGYLDFAGNMDLCITIRTILASGGTLHMQAGAGIVADSRPDAEWEETENKLRALLTAVAVAGRSHDAAAQRTPA